MGSAEVARGATASTRGAMDRDDRLMRLANIEETLVWCEEYFAKASELDAARLCAKTVVYSPLANRVAGARGDVQMIRLAELEAGGSEQRAG